MQNSGIIKFLTIVLVLVCFYELTFTFKSRSVEQDAKTQAKGDASKYRDILKAKDNEVVFNFIGAEYTYKECKQREINLGLDLRGGVSVTLEISLENLVIQKAGSNAEKPEFKKALQRAIALKSESQDNFVVNFYRAYKELNQSGQIQQSFVSLFKNRDNTDKLADGANDDAVIDYLQEYANQAIDESFKVLRTRVAQFGIAQPSIKRVGNTGRIMVDLPGIEDIERVRRVLQGSARLEFWDTYNAIELEKEIFATDKEAYNLEQRNKEVADSTKVSEVVADVAKASTDAINSIINLDSTTTSKKDSAVAKTDKKEEQQQPLLAKLNWKSKLHGLVRIDDTSKVRQYLSLGKEKDILPRNLEVGWGNEPVEVEGKIYSVIYFLRGGRDGKGAGLQGDVIKRASADNDQINGEPIVSLDFNLSGMSTWADMTGVSFETGRPIAIVMDGQVFSAPVARNGAIKDGSTKISGGSADKNSNWNHDLATVLNAGRFPAPVKIVEEAYVGPSLGQESIQAGFLSFIIAVLVVLAYMAFYYSQAGWIANVALFGNLFFVVGILAAFPTVSLTLPGVAGIVLTVGMSVDANVLIYERIREELRAGKGLKLAINDGYKHALSAIIDSNLVTGITGLILWYFGSGVIEGFAQTLVIGIISSLFAAVVISRLIFEIFMKKDRNIAFASKLTQNFMVGANYKILPHKNKAYIVSAIVIGIGFVSFFTRGFDLGVDFSGGRNYTVRFDKELSVSDLQTSLGDVFIDASGNKQIPEVKQYGDKNQYSITTKYLYNESGDAVSAKVEQKLFEGLKPYFPADFTFDEFKKGNSEKKIGKMNSMTVGAEIADDIQASAFWSVTVSLIMIFIYILIRFKKWQYSFGAVAALFHDVLLVMAIFSLFWGFVPFSMEVNQHFIAAILTVFSYSITDTVVIFDRIREYQSLYKNRELPVLANDALNSTLGRTINTSMNIIIVLLAMFIFGGESIRGFSFALLIGIIVGTYSSLYIATPIYVDLAKDKKNNA